MGNLPIGVSTSIQSSIIGIVARTPRTVSVGILNPNREKYPQILLRSYLSKMRIPPSRLANSFPVQATVEATRASLSTWTLTLLHLRELDPPHNAFVMRVYAYSFLRCYNAIGHNVCPDKLRQCAGALDSLSRLEEPKKTKSGSPSWIRTKTTSFRGILRFQRPVLCHSTKGLYWD